MEQAIRMEQPTQTAASPEAAPSTQTQPPQPRLVARLVLALAHNDRAEVAAILIEGAPASFRQNAALVARVAHILAGMILRMEPLEDKMELASPRDVLLRGIRRLGGAAERAQRLEELVFKAMYGLNAIQRIARAPDKAQALRRERTYQRFHLNASKKRRDAARLVDKEAKTRGNLLGWHGIRDKSTDPVCLAHIGGNFSPDRRPAAGWPGAVHPYCRCFAGAAFPDGRLLT